MTDYSDLKARLGFLTSPAAECMPDGARLTALCNISRTALAAIEELEGRNQWQPIETAPKDGTEILGAWYYGGWSYQPMVWRNGWVKKFDAMCLLKPTRWMPLPQPPEQDQWPRLTD